MTESKINPLPWLAVDRNSLRQQVANIVRDLIISGRIAPGTKITERDVAERLKISRMPARDALLDLEREGLIVARPRGRYVIELSKNEVRQLYQVRTALEKLALEEAIRCINPDGETELRDTLEQMRRAVAQHDVESFTGSDIRLHAQIWQITANPTLINSLISMTGPIFMFIATQIRFEENWSESLALHTRLVEAICDRDLEQALAAMEDHMQNSLQLAMRVYQEGIKPVNDPAGGRG